MKRLVAMICLASALTGCETTAVQGRVLLPGGEPAAGADVGVFGHRTTTDLNGEFCLELAVGGSAPRLGISVDGYASWVVELVGAVDVAGGPYTLPTLTMWEPNLRASSGSTFEWEVGLAPAGAEYTYVLERNLRGRQFRSGLREVGEATRFSFDDRLVQDDAGGYHLALHADTGRDRFVARVPAEMERSDLVPVSRGRGCIGLNDPFGYRYEDGDPLPACRYTDGDLNHWGGGSGEGVLVDLGESVDVDAVSVSHVGHLVSGSFLLHAEVSDDRTSWKPFGSVAVVTSEHSVGYGMIFADSSQTVRARYVRVDFDRDSSEVLIGEVGVWAR